MALSRGEIDERCRLVDEADTEDFATLAVLAGLDKGKHFRNADLSGVSFRGTDLRGFDFTASRLHGCDFKGARIAGAYFAQAEIGAVLHENRDNPNQPARLTGIANLQTAADWDEYLASFAKTKKWNPPSGPWEASHLPVGAIFSDVPGVTPELVVVPSGSFLMGSPDGSGGINGEKAEENRFDDEGPRRQVRFDRPFAIGRFPVTVAEFLSFRRGKKKVESTHPVGGVSWNDAGVYCRLLNERLGLAPGTYRLPSEAEWEYACRAGTETRYWWGDTWDSKMANKGGETTPVDRYPSNGWGLHDMLGNVWEWCEDNWHENYSGDPPADRSVWQGGDSESRVVRGGSWNGDPDVLRSAYRLGSQPGNRNYNLGFRVARTL